MGGNNIKHTSVRVALNHPDAKLPKYGSEEAAGADLYSVQHKILQPGSKDIVDTGIIIELDPGFEAQIRPRSGLAAVYGVTVLNAPGTIDSDYRGRVGVLLVNHGSLPFEIKVGDRIAQMVIAPVVHGDFHVAKDDLSDTKRGGGGFGSTGKN